MHLTVQGKIVGLKSVFKNSKMSHGGGGGRKRAKKVSRIFWMAPNCGLQGSIMLILILNATANFSYQTRE